MKNTKEAAQEWVSKLAPGDEVLYLDHWGEPFCVLHVAKVTPTGIVRTKEKRSFQQHKWARSFFVNEIAGTYGRIVPYDETLANEANELQKRIAAENVKKAKLNKAKTLCYELAYGKRQMTLALAEAIIEAFEAASMPLPAEEDKK